MRAIRFALRRIRPTSPSSAAASALRLSNCAAVLIEEGPDVLTLIGLLVVAVLSLGVFGALTEPSPKRRRKD